MWVVGSAAGPLGGDAVAFEIDVAAGTSLTVHGVAATIALAADAEPSRHTVCATVGAGATFRWAPEPLILSRACDHRAAVEIAVDPSATLVWREELLLGRSGEEPGSCDIRLRIDRAGAPVLRHGLVLGPAAPWFRSHAGVGHARAVGLAVVVDPAIEAGGTIRLAPGAAVLPLEAGAAAVVSVLAGDAVELRDLLERGIAASLADRARWAQRRGSGAQGRSSSAAEEILAASSRLEPSSSQHASTPSRATCTISSQPQP